MLRLVFTAMILFGAMANSASASIIINAGHFIGSGGAGTGQSLAGDRFRSFGNTGANENYLGVPSLGVAANRVERNIIWATGTLTSYDFTFQYDQVNDKLVSTIAGGTLEYAGWSTKLAGLGKTKVAADLNAFQISVKQGDAGSSVYLTDIVLDGNALGNFTPTGTITNDWLVTGSSMNLTDGFTLTGKLWLKGPFGTSQENSAVNLTAGWDERGVAFQAIPEPGSLLVWGVFGLAGVGLTNRRRKS